MQVSVYSAVVESIMFEKNALLGKGDEEFAKNIP